MVFCEIKKGDDPEGLEGSGNFMEEVSSVHIYWVPRLLKVHLHLGYKDNYKGVQGIWQRNYLLLFLLGKSGLLKKSRKLNCVDNF